MFLSVQMTFTKWTQSIACLLLGAHRTTLLMKLKRRVQVNVIEKNIQILLPKNAKTNALKAGMQALISSVNNGWLIRQHL